jgi:hypothetical protein
MMSMTAVASGNASTINETHYYYLMQMEAVLSRKIGATRCDVTRATRRTTKMSRRFFLSTCLRTMMTVKTARDLTSDF